MTEDATLDEFFGADDESETSPTGASADDSAPAEGDPSADPPDEEPVGAKPTPFVPTYRWTPAGGTCADCGATVERRWSDERDGTTVLVCRECRDW